MKVAAIQLHVTDEETPSTRMDAVSSLVQEESERGADIVLLPEMWLPGYFGFDHYKEVAEELGGPMTDTLSALALGCGVHLCAGSVVERQSDRLYNSTLLFDRGGDLIVTYRKIHLFGYGTREQELLSRGDEVVTCHVAGATVGLSTCYDLRFPEIYRRMVDQGAEVFFVVAGWPFPRIDAWRCLSRARAIEDQAALVACNASGKQGGSTFAGSSMAYNAWGSCLGELDDRPGVLRCEIDADSVRTARADYPALRNRVL